MIRLIPLLGMALLLAPPALIAQDKKIVPISWAQTHRHYGKWKTVNGKIVAVYRDRRYLHLHFDKDAKKYFTVLIPRRRLKYFPKDAEEFYKDKDVLVYGKIRRRDRRPVMFLKRRSYIWVVGSKAL